MSSPKSSSEPSSGDGARALSMVEAVLDVELARADALTGRLSDDREDLGEILQRIRDVLADALEVFDLADDDRERLDAMLSRVVASARRAGVAL